MVSKKGTTTVHGFISRTLPVHPSAPLLQGRKTPGKEELCPPIASLHLLLPSGSVVGNITFTGRSLALNPINRSFLVVSSPDSALIPNAKNLETVSFLSVKTRHIGTTSSSLPPGRSNQMLCEHLQPPRTKDEVPQRYGPRFTSWSETEEDPRTSGSFS
ncbi:uncharacterized protein LOC108836540 [Raphanus sativus]|uniref:Uncharacterized protein LOC108836540 n=1 Tax=Raphanus sativus TaxID=3726 RepID=A0A6J0M0K8_RAPSA|nr:uncharacterized protein LOC108836540 [Raphanus sativus]